MVNSANLTSTPTTVNYGQDTPALSNKSTGEAVATTGAGTAAEAGNVSGTGDTPPMGLSQARDILVGSLRKLKPEMSPEQVQTMLLEVFTKIKDTMGANENEKVKTDQEAKRLALQDKQARITQSEEKQTQAAEKREKLSVWDKVKIAFQYVGAIMAFVGAAIALATSWLTGPAGVAAAVMLIGAGVLLLCLAIDATYAAAKDGGGAKGSMGLVGDMHKAVLMSKGMDEKEAIEKAQKADSTAKIVFTAVAGALMLGAAIANITSAVQLGFSVMTYVQGGAGIATNVVSATSTAATATGDIVSAVGKRDATNLEAAAKRLDGEAKQFQALVSFIEDMIDLTMARMKGMHETFEANLDALVSAIKDMGESLGRVGMKA